MTDRPPNHSTPEDDLFDYASNPVNPTNDLERTVQQVRQALTADTTAMPDSIRQQIREELMPSPAARSIGFATSVSSAQTDAPFSPTRRVDAPRSRFMDSVSRWQPVVSMTIVIALLASVVALTYHRGMLDSPEGSGNSSAFQVADEGDLQFDVACSAQSGEQLSDDELRGHSITDFPIPAYGLAMHTVGPPQTQVVQTFINFLACYSIRFGDSSLEPSDAELSYYSDRLRYFLMYDELDTEQQAAIDSYLERSPVSRIISDFPLPINRYDAYLTTVDPDSVPFPEIFAHYDVYSIDMDRWVGIIGNVSTHMIQTGQPVRTGDGELVYISFIQQGDAFVIDEMFMICPSDFAAELELGTATPSTHQAPFNPAQLLVDPGLTCS